MAILGGVLAFHDAGLLDCVELDCGVLCSDGEGCAAENRLYFDDFLENERVAGDARLFVGTLPTTAPGAAAMALKIHGPCYYALPGSDDVAYVWREMESLVGGKAGSAVLLLHYTENSMVALLARHGQRGPSLDAIDGVRSIHDALRRLRRPDAHPGNNSSI